MNDKALPHTAPHPLEATEKPKKRIPYADLSAGPIYTAHCHNSFEWARSMLGRAKDGQALIADKHEKTYGRDGRSWEQFTGQLLLTYILKPKTADHFPHLVMALSVGLIDALREHVPSTYLEWPNDAMIDGRKVAGLMCSGEWGDNGLEGIIVGIGINYNSDIPPAHPLRPFIVSLHEITKKKLPEMMGATAIGRAISPWYHAWKCGEYDKIFAAWKAALGEPDIARTVTVHTARGEEISGSIGAYNPDGSIVFFDDETGIKEIIPYGFIARDPVIADA